MSKGTLYGVGVGPGDPELLTLKAVRLLRDCDIIAIPQKKDRCFALRIVLDALPELADKPLLEIVMPMTRDKDARERAHQKGAAALAEQLDKDLNVVYITLGDPTIYSTYGYLQRRIQEMGYETETVPGVPSFCAAAAALDISLCEDRDELHLLPGGINADQALAYPGTKVFMKGEIPVLLDAAKNAGQTLIGVQNCGTEAEELYHSTEEIPADAGYYTLIIAKENN